MRHIHSAFRFSRPSTPLLLGPLLAGMLLLATGCSSTHRVVGPSGGQGESPSDAYGYSRVTAEVADETVQVFLRSGQEMKLENLYVGPDSTTGTLPQGGERTFPTSALRKIEVVDHEMGFWQGAGIGLGTGLGATLVSVGTQKSDFSQSLALVGGLIVSVPLTLVGGLIGAGTGQKEVYRFPERSPGSNGTTALPERRAETVRPPEK